jgi:hypothetical protein
MNPNERKVVKVETRMFRGHYMEGVVMTCGHWQKMPAGVVCDYSNATYRAFTNGEKRVSCQTCARMAHEVKQGENCN